MHSLFKTADVDLAAFLVCRGFSVLEVEPPTHRPWHAEFVFDSASDALYSAMRAWHESDEATVNAREFAKARVRLYRQAREAVDRANPDHRARGLAR